MIKQKLKQLISSLGIDIEKNKFFQMIRNIRFSEKIAQDMLRAQTVQTYPVTKYLSAQESSALIGIVIFSYDRAFQLDALLGSFTDNVVNSTHIPITILYRFSTPEHQVAYKQVFARHEKLQIKLVPEEKGKFYEMAINVVAEMNTEKIMFLVDDIIIHEQVDITEFARLPSDVFIPSLRLGKNTTYCYALQSNQIVPQFITQKALQEKVGIPNPHVWRWSDGDKDWSRPLSVDGNIFDRGEYLLLMQSVSFRSPNTMEDAVAVAFDGYYKYRLGICYTKSKLVNLPFNNVMRADHGEGNRYGVLHQDTLLQWWQEGKMMDYSKLYQYSNKGVHEEIPFEVILRSDSN